MSFDVAPTLCAIIAGGTAAERERKRERMLASGCGIVMLASDMREAADVCRTMKECLPDARVDVIALDQAAARASSGGANPDALPLRLGGTAVPFYNDLQPVVPEFNDQWRHWNVAPR